MPPAASPADSQVLPPKEAALFRQLLKQQETKQYKKGLKTADAILKKVKDHGETMAMKALVLNGLRRKAEAYELVRAGVRADVRSPVCWHVFGLIYRSDDRHEDAARCYKQALRLDPGNSTILRDLAMLQVQTRDLEGLIESRTALLQLRPGFPASWLALASAHALAGNLEIAVEVLDALEANAEASSDRQDPYEVSEVAAFRAQLLEEAGSLSEALASHERALAAGQVRDRLGSLVSRSRLLVALGRGSEAEPLLWRALAATPDDHSLHALLARARGLELPEGGVAAAGPLPAETVAELSALYADLSERLPYAQAPRRAPLDFLPACDPDFRRRADAYIRRGVFKGVPSLHADLAPLYADPAKAAILEGLVRGLETELAEQDAEGRAAATDEAPSTDAAGANGDLSPSAGDEGIEVSGTDAAPAARAAKSPAPPTKGAKRGGKGAAAAPVDRTPLAMTDAPHLAWARLLEAHRLRATGSLEQAEALLAEATVRWPRLPELHSARSRVLAEAGDANGAFEAAEAARKLDAYDRYLNCEAVERAFGRCDPATAASLAARFVKEGEDATALVDMQASWYELAAARCHSALGDAPRALSKYLRTLEHFTEFREDEFDFHAYCLRKQTLRAYHDLLRFEDRLLTHPTYGEACRGAISAYVQVWRDNARKAREEVERKARIEREVAEAAAARAAAAAAEGADAAAAAALDPKAAKKAAAARARRERKKAEAAASKAADPSTSAPAPARKPSTNPDDRHRGDPDPDGAVAAATPDPLGDAAALARALVAAAPGVPDNQLALLEVELLRGRLLAAAAAAAKAAAVAGPADPRVHAAIAQVVAAAADAAEGRAGVAELSGPDAVAAEALAAACQRLVGAEGAADPLRSLAATWTGAWAATDAASSLRGRVAVAQASVALGLEPAAQAAAKLAAGGLAGASHALAAEVAALLASGPLADAASLAAWREAGARAYPRSGLFAAKDIADGLAAVNL